MRRFALLFTLGVACVPRGLVEEAKDRDRDGFAAWQLGGDDCDDAEATVNPDAEEVCGNAQDDDCDGDTDEDGLGATTWYVDVDQDGFGDSSGPRSACARPAGYAAAGGDCDDRVTAVNPGAEERCGNGRDDDCDETVDDVGLGATTWYRDQDGDGHGRLTDHLDACAAPEGYVVSADDCDDTTDAIRPGIAEICGNGVDDNCDASAAPCELRGTRGLGTADVRIRGTERDLLLGRALASWSEGGQTILALGAGHVFLTDYSPGRVYIGPVAAPPPQRPSDLGLTQAPPIEADVMRAHGQALVSCDLDADPAPELVVFDARYVPGSVGGIATFQSSAINVFDTPIGAAWTSAVATIGSTDPAAYPGGGSGRRLLCGDVDGDGGQDLIAALAGDHGVIAFLGPLSGSLGVEQAEVVASSGYLLDAGDIDDDGRVEILIADGAGNVAIRGRAPAGAWSSERALVGSGLGWSGTFTDVDGDGAVDLALVEQTDAALPGRALVYLHDTLSTTTPLSAADADCEVVGSTTANIRAVGTPGDLDDDGDEELCVVAPSDDTLGSNTGAIYCFWGRSEPSASAALEDADLVLVGEAAGSALGPADFHRDARIVRDVDVDVDGVLDLVVGWPYNDTGAVDAGAVFVVYGLSL